VLPWGVVRVGFLTHLLWDRYGPFWETLVRSVGAEVVHPDPEAVLERMLDARVAQADALAFQIAIAASLSLAEVDVLVVPQLLAEDRATRGVAQDPWVAALPTMLERSVPGLPPVVGVPARLSADVEGTAVGLLRRLTGDVGAIRRAWSTHHPDARPARRRALAAVPAGVRSSALLGSPWWATERVVAATALADERGVVGPWQVPPEALREEGRRSDGRLADSDAEALGALRRFARSGSVARLVWLHDAQSGSEAWLLRRAEALVGDRLEVFQLDEIATPQVWVRVLLGGKAGGA
jgi:hypothetical protein